MTVIEHRPGKPRYTVVPDLLPRVYNLDLPNSIAEPKGYEMVVPSLVRYIEEIGNIRRRLVTSIGKEDLVTLKTYHSEYIL